MNKQTGGKSTYGNPIFCGKNEVPAGRVRGSAPRCFNMGMRVGFAAGIRKGREEGVPEGQQQAEAIFEAERQALKEGQRRSNIKFGKAGESIGRVVGLREGRLQPQPVPVQEQSNITDLGNLNSVNVSVLRNLVQRLLNVSPSESRRIRTQYSDNPEIPLVGAKLTKPKAIEILRGEGLPAGFVGQGSTGFRKSSYCHF